MNHKSGFNALSRTAAHRRAMIRNMVTSLFRYGRITTTKAKALEVRKFAEKLITRSKVDTVHNRRQAARFISDKTILAKLFLDIGQRMKNRLGGYTRILKLGFREGDAAEIVLFELVDYTLPDITAVEAKKAEKKKRREESQDKRKEQSPDKRRGDTPDAKKSIAAGNRGVAPMRKKSVTTTRKAGGEG
ncbi:MAG: 50S ribosomal protein L17 [Spirochaetaceae bacterium]|nr:50S ribosomal protein L17 [Spirochaetaceae bacterium]